ncbi:YdcF family protein [Clostridium sp. NSJ-6]|uniref:YdcF family protein n=1 Tax=Clostridium hominis TaxID=2763036 RepID=A0ABR7DH26_9CLOT|nr:YdcF family protein [Clostridium hominis]MDU2672101.1 YdcF family protein [Clostridium sp.]
MKNKVDGKEKKLLYKICLWIGLALIIYYIGLRLISGFVAFSSMFCLLGIILFIYGFIELKFKVNIWGRIPKLLKRIIIVLFFIGMSIFIIIEGVIIYNGHHYDKERPDYLMVLGAGLRGSKISTSLLYRLETAVEYNKLYPDVKIIVSGGQGPDEDISEAKAMKDYLISKGIDESLIISEDKSTNTYENFLFTKKILEDETGEEDFTVTVISNNFHMYRAKYLGKQVGFECLGYPAPSHAASSFIFYTREFFGVIKAYIFKR